MFGSAFTLLENLINKGLNSNICGEAKGAFKDLRSFEFVFILLLLHKILEISDMLCQVLQSKSQDILNAMNFVSTTKMLLLDVVSFYDRYEMDIPNINGRHLEGTKRSCQQKDNVIV
ncbi:hypothetical protein ACOSQ4_017295 [Xanthoceras sorbifolium]